MAGTPQQNGSTSTSLVRRAQQADAVAWEKLTRLYGPVVYGWARQSGLQPDDAADVMQNVFHSLTTRLTQFQRLAAQQPAQSSPAGYSQNNTQK